ncbi:MATE family efflux transporter [Clostridium algidicarnis]|uniref:MATE family efflux transporter n=1 Tax=Clostridium algidicarnis TaxID=37659 RepID=UPI001C0B5FFE|nr:MATE family efflux transporter [Clostridium algidicarnis]MBU3205789.1 MATE family efflux transporter [Clostridium algidicarnis]
MNNKRFKELFSDRRFYKSTFILAMPIVLQYLIASSINMLDTVMIGKVGEIELASVGIVNQYYFLFSLIAMGISSGCSVFIAQLWGKKDKENIRKVLGIGLFSGIIVTFIFTIIALIWPQGIISIFNKDKDVIALGSQYLRIVSISYIFTTITFNFATASRSIEKTVVPMLASLVGLIVNGFLNYVFIFGKFGFPVMGVKGAALATVIARIMECLVLLIHIYVSKSILSGRLRDFRGASKKLTLNVYNIIIPVVLNEACWGLGNVSYAIIYGRIGTQAIAAIQICTTILNLFMIVTFGLANASVVVVGKEIGAGNEETGKLYARRLCAISIGIGMILSVVLFLSTSSILSIFNVSDVVIRDAKYILYIYALFMPVKVYNALVIVGILRAGGDAKYGVIVQSITLWLIGVPFAFLAAFIFKLPVYMVVLVACSEEIVKVIILIKRFISYKWINNMVEELEVENSIR